MEAATIGVDGIDPSGDDGPFRVQTIESLKHGDPATS
jgi:hypothetical protein